MTVPALITLRRPVEAHFVRALNERGIRAAYRDLDKSATTTIEGEWIRFDPIPQWPHAPAAPAFAIVQRAAGGAGGYALPWQAVEHALRPLCDVCGQVLGEPATLVVKRKTIGNESREWRLHSELCAGCAGAIPHNLIGRILADGSIDAVDEVRTAKGI